MPLQTFNYWSNCWYLITTCPFAGLVYELKHFHWPIFCNFPIFPAGLTEISIFIFYIYSLYFHAFNFFIVSYTSINTRYYCKSGQECCGTGCMPAGKVCCQTSYCETGHTCCSFLRCCPAGTFCSGFSCIDDK